jgi:GNAT superfamily N-acetyltransferase
MRRETRVLQSGRGGDFRYGARHASRSPPPRERRHPRQRHYYLPYIGVRPAAQGRGLGTALLQPVLERCDRERLPAYLEASSPDNARLYRRLGFTTLETIRPLGSPPIELMIRNPD